VVFKTGNIVPIEDSYQHDSDTTSVTPRYSTSALERDNVGCCLTNQESRLSPRYTQPKCESSGVWTFTPVCVSIGDELINGGRI
jgi:hypothetical protein